MANRSEKKDSIRTQIISAAQLYGTELAGKDFLYDRSIENSADGEFVDFIFSKDSSKDKYDTICFSEKEIPMPNTIKDLLSSELLSKFD